ncbi:MAG: DUF2975 domain-containing protein [Ruminococcaceae bacterium]|nr:DUF2975 domain-containing protein [Oscillospiraceae bacterium]
MKKNFYKLGNILAKILEVFHWVGTALMAAATVCAAIQPEWVKYFVGFEAKECCGATLTVYGFQTNVPVIHGEMDWTAFLLFGIGATLILAVMALVFRNLHLIFKNSENASPFQKDNIRRMREIGYFSIAVPVVGLIMSIVVRLITGVDATENSMDMNGVFMGVLVLCLTQIFVHGAQLEQDVDGLL